MYTSYYRLLAEKLDVCVNNQLGELAVGIHLPCRVSVVLYYLSTSQLEECLDGVALVVEVAHHVRAL